MRILQINMQILRIANMRILIFYLHKFVDSDYVYEDLFNQQFI
jgi:hypothetical protein